MPISSNTPIQVQVRTPGPAGPGVVGYSKAELDDKLTAKRNVADPIPLTDLGGISESIVPDTFIASLYTLLASGNGLLRTTAGILTLIPYPLDVTAPTCTGGTIDTNGTSLTLAFSEAVTYTGSTSGFTITPSGGAATLTYVSGSGTASLVFTISRTIQSGETCTRTYSGSNWTDLSNNALGAFTTQAVTNSSTQSGSMSWGAEVGRQTYTNLTGGVVVYTFGATIAVGQSIVGLLDIDDNFGISTVVDSKGNSYAVRSSNVSGANCSSFIFSGKLTTQIVSGDTLTITMANTILSTYHLMMKLAAGLSATASQHDASSPWSTNAFASAVSVPGTPAAGTYLAIGVVYASTTQAYSGSGWTTSAGAWSAKSFNYNYTAFTGTSGSKDFGGSFATTVSWNGHWVALK